MEYLNKVLQGDCLKVLGDFPDNSIDMVLCDLPYGMTNNPWDQVIELNRLWNHYERIVKERGVVVLFGAGRFTGQLIESNPRWFKYKIVWLKSKSTNFLNANRQPLRKHEDICVFYRKQPIYNPQKKFGLPYDKGYRNDKQTGSYGKFGRYRSISVDGLRFPSDVLFVEQDEPVDWAYFATAERDGIYHPTQKPVELGRWLIRTYTNPGCVVLDNACGAGSFLVAAVMENRDFIGIELNREAYHFGTRMDFITICNERIRKAKESGGTMSLFVMIIH
ncbi:DNA-methyltransferase [Olivibacter jilunii]|uniref:DNA-methyltransferase n=1 Tax=Olivibacter jilunii TaxID=985016 RepID=UPI00103042B7|nr:site-specific DNA-methyltransferase [Olivibacter jilunii]